jgi:hypothetical protein
MHYFAPTSAKAANLAKRWLPDAVVERILRLALRD